MIGRNHKAASTTEITEINLNFLTKIKEIHDMITFFNRLNPVDTNKMAIFEAGAHLFLPAQSPSFLGPSRRQKFSVWWGRLFHLPKKPGHFFGVLAPVDPHVIGRQHWWAIHRHCDTFIWSSTCQQSQVGYANASIQLVILFGGLGCLGWLGILGLHTP